MEQEQRTIARMPTETFKKIDCFRHVDQSIDESVMEQFDLWFMENNGRIDVYSTKTKEGYRFHFEKNGQHIFVDWSEYRTWANTFHLRFKRILEALNISSSTPFIHPEKLFMVANRMKTYNQLRPTSLKEALAA